MNSNLNIKIGLEAHQQLSGKKLFCNCLTDMSENNKIIEIKRKIRPAAGETGSIDMAGEFEKSRDRTFIYYGYENEVCLIDVDEQPPNSINKGALITALSIAKFFNLNIPKKLQVMRKGIFDGSAITSFQRSILIGLGTKNSFIETPYGKVTIKDLYLEEDASKIINTEDNLVYYSLSRSGIPLIEISTNPDIKSAEQADHAAREIGMILRSFPSIKRGIGTIRQDINLSVNNSPRIEIKGFQDIRTIKKTIEYEVNRILNNKIIKSEVRKANQDSTTSFLRPMPGSSRLYPESDVPIIEITQDLLNLIVKPELISEKILNLQKKYKLNPQLAQEIIKEEINFSYFADKFNLDPNLIANILIEIPKEIKSRFNLDSNKIRDYHFKEIFEKLSKKEIPKEAVKEILIDICSGKKVDYNKYKKIDLSIIEKDVIKIINENKNASLNAIMGILMKKYRGKVEGKILIELIKKNLK